MSPMQRTFMKHAFSQTRRSFIRTSLLSGVAAAVAPGLARVRASEPGEPAGPARVALCTGTDRAKLTFEGLRHFEGTIRRQIQGRRVVIKPNNVSIDTPLCATHADCIEGILEFLKSIGRTEDIIIAESAAGGPTLEGFSNYGYTKLASKYPVKLVDLDHEPVEAVHVFDEKDFRPHRARLSRVLLDPASFIISATRFKTHDRVVATLSLKNIIFGAPIKDTGFRWGPSNRAGARNDKPIVHGSGFRAINYNLFALAQRLHPHLSVLDGVEGMEGNGPVGGTPVDHRVMVISPDWLAADRLAVALMGIDVAKVGYLTFCAEANLGQADIAKMEILGPVPQDHIKKYKLSDNIEKQLIWMKPAAA